MAGVLEAKQLATVQWQAMLMLLPINVALNIYYYLEMVIVTKAGAVLYTLLSQSELLYAFGFALVVTKTQFDFVQAVPVIMIPMCIYLYFI